MQYREATINDIPHIQKIRHSVTENILSNPALVTDEDCAKYLTINGKGWVCEDDNAIVGFSIADLLNHNIWALFVMPGHTGKGIGKTLYNIMLNWYFSQTNKTVWLSAAYNTRAEQFYLLQGWENVGLYGTKEIKFQMTADTWNTRIGSH